MLAGEFAKTARVTLVTLDPRLSRRQLERSTALPWAERVPRGCGHVHLASPNSGPVRLSALAFRFAALARIGQFDVVYTFLTYTNVMVALARVVGRGRYIHVGSEHAMATSLRSNGRGLRVLAKALPVLYGLPDAIVVVSEAARRSLEESGVLKRASEVATIPNPVDTHRVRALSLERIPASVQDLFAHGKHVVACVARLHHHKDHATLLRAMALLPQSITLLVVGEGSLRPQLEAAAARLGITSRVTFCGELENPYPVMLASDVVVLTSREEGFGLVALEAVTLGVPFVGADVGGLGEVCRTLGCATFPSGDATALAAAIGNAVARPQATAVSPVAADPFHVFRIAQSYLALAPLTKARGTTRPGRAEKE
jgi:glycosyltransferase involved in cell wall biosynthesis